MKYDPFERLDGTTKVEIDASNIDATNVDMPQGKLEAITGAAQNITSEGDTDQKVQAGTRSSVGCGWHQYFFGSS